MKVFINRIAAALSLGVVAASQLAAQGAAACDPTANTRGDIAKAQFSMTRAISAGEKGNPTHDLQEVLRLADNGTVASSEVWSYDPVADRLEQHRAWSPGLLIRLARHGLPVDAMIPDDTGDGR